MRTIHEASMLAGVSVRTLRHYDAIGLLKPSAVTPAGYRLYDDTALARLQQILLLRELEFPLKEIKTLLDQPGFRQEAALEQQIQLLELKIQHMQNLISLAREIKKTGAYTMNFSAFDNTEFERYAAEVKQKWGDTAAYREYAQRNGQPADMTPVLAEIGKFKNLSPASDEAQAAIQTLRQFITDHYYTCTPSVLQGLGQMYIADERFRQNIDKAGGEGTAAFLSRAIAIYCDQA